jgi:hypothetical protein
MASNPALLQRDIAELAQGLVGQQSSAAHASALQSVRLDGDSIKITGQDQPGVVKRPIFSHRKSVLYGAFVWARRMATNSPGLLFTSRAVLASEKFQAVAQPLSITLALTERSAYPNSGGVVYVEDGGTAAALACIGHVSSGVIRLRGSCCASFSPL